MGDHHSKDYKQLINLGPNEIYVYQYPYPYNNRTTTSK